MSDDPEPVAIDIRRWLDKPDWHARAACTGINPELFFPERGASTTEAKGVCRGCEVRCDCLDYAMLSGPEIRRVGRNLGARATQTAAERRMSLWCNVYANGNRGCIRPSRQDADLAVDPDYVRTYVIELSPDGEHWHPITTEMVG